jgi:hypothetical protein
MTDNDIIELAKECGLPDRVTGGLRYRRELTAFFHEAQRLKVEEIRGGSR